MVELFEALLPLIGEWAPVEEEAEDDRDDAPLKLAIVGRPNAGKSTLINRMLGEDRLITGPEAGITRDSISIDWEWPDPKGGSRQVRLVDTAGMRKRAKVQDKLENCRSPDAAARGRFRRGGRAAARRHARLEAQDLRIADRVIEEGRALVIALNKWDVAEGPSALFNGVKGALEDGLSQVKGGAAAHRLRRDRQGDRCTDRGVFRDPRGVVEAGWHRRAQPLVRQGVDRQPAAAPGGKRIKMRYVTQVKTRPPSFVVFGTRVDQLPASYERYLVNSMRRELGFGGRAGAG